MSLDNLVGQTLSQYQLRELLGVGGMGSVYRAYQTNLKREVAVKIISPQLLANTEAMARFIREAEVSAQLEHSNIVPIYDFGTQRGITYVVMRMLTGGSLSRRIEQRIEDGRPLISLGETADLLKHVASALDYAHSRGVIHRDIKPANIMFDNQGKPFVVDFGIAKITQGATSFTQTGTAMGTPNYMPPEQWRGEQPTPMADQYALAVMTYQLLTGRMPFEADSAFALMHKHLHEQPTPLSVFRPDIPPALMRVLDKAMAKDYRQRFQSCTAFAQAFESAIEGNKGNVTGMFLFPVRPSQQHRMNQVFTPSGNYPRSKSSKPLVWGLGFALIAVIGLFIAFILMSNNNTINTPDSTATTSSSVVILSTDTATNPVLDAGQIARATRDQFLTETAQANQPDVDATVIAELTRLFMDDLTLTALVITPTELSTDTPIPTETPTETSIPTELPTETPIPTATPTELPTETPVPTLTPTDIFIPTFTPPPIPTLTHIPSLTPITPTVAPTKTPRGEQEIRVTATLDTQAMTMLAPFTETAQALLASPTELPTDTPATPLLMVDFTITQATPTDLNITVSATASGGTGNYTYSWNFGDTATADGQSANHAYANAGTYSITLTINDGANSVNVVKDVTINSLPPLAGDFTITQASPTDLNIGVNATASGGTGNYTYSWNFGDTATADGQSANHVYATTGTYSITLTVNDGVNSVIMVKVVTIDSLPPLAGNFAITNVCLVADQGGIKDGNFNALAYVGMQRAEQYFGLQTQIIESDDPADYEPNMETCIRNGANVIVSVGFTQTDAARNIAVAHPEVYIIGVDQFFGDGQPANVVSLLFREDQAGFLVGVMAALVTESNIIGGVYGRDVPAVVKYRNGFEQGARYINPDIVVLGQYTDRFDDPTLGATIAEQFIGEGADVIFGAGGGTGTGGIQYAAERGVYVIGVEQDEYLTNFGAGDSPGAEFVISSATKSVDVGVYDMLAALSGDTTKTFFGGGVYMLEAANNGIGFADRHDSNLSDEVVAQVQAVFGLLKSGELETGVDSVTGEITSTPIRTSVNEEQILCVVEVSVDNAVVRSGPSQSELSLGTLPSGTLLEVLAQEISSTTNAVWYNIRTLEETITGWVRSDLVSVCSIP